MTTVTPISRPSSPTADEILGLYFPVLDHGFIALVDYMGSDTSVEQAARVAYGGGGTRKVSDTRNLLRYLKRHKHTTPMEMVELKFHCCMPMFVARQWIRHRTANVNEMSGRYSLLPMLFYTPPQEQFRKQSASNKQGRGEMADQVEYYAALARWNAQRAEAASHYESLAGNDVARELARIDLPLSTYTQWYWKIDVHNLMHFLGLRVDSHAQWEIRAFGNVMAGMLKRVAPLAYEAWVDYDVCGTRLSYAERRVLARLVQADKANKSIGTTVEEEISAENFNNYDLSGRELDEFLGKFSGAVERPSFDLDLSQAKPPQFFEEKMNAATPALDRNVP